MKFGKLVRAGLRKLLPRSFGDEGLFLEGVRPRAMLLQVDRLNSIRLCDYYRKVCQNDQQGPTALPPVTGSY